MNTPLLPNESTDDLLQILQASRHAGTAARTWLQDAQSTLNQLFPSTPIEELVHARALLIDQLLTTAWQFFQLADTPLALIAVGGYGRRELHPHSDVDLLILAEENIAETHNQYLEGFITFLWDIGLEIGHSVRTLNECINMAASDITIATNIMEARTLCGPATLLDQLTSQTAPEKIWPSNEFFEAKWKEQVYRHQKHHNTEYNLEPDLKNAPGGLRDIQMVGWVAKRHFGVHTLSELIDAGFIREQEYSALKAGQLLLWQIRWALHMVTDRNENRLLFDYQRQVAELLGYQDTNANLAVEQFMKRYYRAALAISVMNEMLLQFYDEAILQKDRKDKITPLNRRFQVRNDYLEITHDNVFQHSPSALLEVFVLMAQNPELKGIRASTFRAMIAHRDCIDDAFRNDIRNTSLFMELIRSPHALFTQLRRMKRYGILGRYLPEFGQIIGTMQYDLFHIYTVDAHTLLVVKNLRTLRHDASREQFPLACDVYHRLPKPELLYIAGLYHDIAKGRGGDHSELGAEDAIAFCNRHGLSKWDAKLVSWLVRNHLLMSVTAQRKDISDPDVVYEFAHQVGDLVHLDYLYTLTIADINATNPNLWNSWRASLLRQLYLETKRALRKGLNNPVDRQDWIDETRDTALMILKQRKVNTDNALQLWANLGEEYFLRETAGDIAWHAEAILQRSQPEDPLVLIRESANNQFEGGTQIFVYTPDTENLFAATVTALDQLNLTIVDARIITSPDGFSLDTYIVLDEHGTPIGDDWPRLQAIREQLTQVLRNPDHFPDVISKRMPRRHKHFHIPTQVVISNDLNNERTVVEIQTLDRPGLLALVGQIFADANLLIQNARIATLGERAEDVFFITDKHNQPISDPELCIQLQQRIESELDLQLEETRA